ncbi:MAG: hypothetical protein P8Z36_09285 [Gemmatimonadota bacterium]|jgi:hypothetical protein
MGYIIGMVLALGLGIYLGLGRPGTKGPEDRVLPSGMRRRRKRPFTPLDLLRQHKSWHNRNL